MTTTGGWRKSTQSGGQQGSECVEVKVTEGDHVT